MRLARSESDARIPERLVPTVRIHISEAISGRVLADFHLRLSLESGSFDGMLHVASPLQRDTSPPPDPVAGKIEASRAPVLDALDGWIDHLRALRRKPATLKAYRSDTARVIREWTGHGHLRSRGDPFTTLARSIVGQQISVKAAQTVWDRFAALSRKLTPAGVLKLKVDDMRAAGLSARKVEYLVDLALHFDSGAVHVGDWQQMDDEAIIAELVAIRGIGRWTAEMFLIFHLMRPNVLPLDDVGLINGISRNYFSGEPVSRSDAREVAQAWSPYCTVATWYIWRSLDPLPVAY